MGIIDRIRAYAGQGGSDAERAGGPSGSAAPSSQRSPLELRIIKELQGALAQDGRAPVRYRFLFTGNVQGVGFRWTNQGTARELGLTGWVLNLNDGSVEMEIQGPSGAIIKHLDTVHAYYSRMRCRVWLTEAQALDVQSNETGFSVRY